MALEKTTLFSDMTIEMIKVGESTGSLEEMLTNVADFLDEENDQKLSTLASMVEPLMLVFMAIEVAGMLMAVYLPLLQAAGGGAKF